MVHAKFQHRSSQCLYSGSVQGKRLLRKNFEIDSMDILPICTLILGFVKGKKFFNLKQDMSLCSHFQYVFTKNIFENSSILFVDTVD